MKKLEIDDYDDASIALEEAREEETEEELQEYGIWKKGFLNGMIFGILMVFLLLTGLFTGFWFGGFRNSIFSDFSTIKKMISMENYINACYLEDVDRKQMTESTYKGLVNGLGDIYSCYYTAEEYKEIAETNVGEYTGIGTTMAKQEDGTVLIIECKEDGPAALAGILPGDWILEINGQSVLEMELKEISSCVKNNKSDTIILKIGREGEEDREIEITVASVEYDTVIAQMLDEEIGYMYITDFKGVTAKQFQEKLEMLRDQEVKSLIIDVRNNPGGLVTSVCDVLRQILPEGLIMYTEDKNGKREEQYCDGTSPLKIPLFVLINEKSASAAEIFAGAVKDYGIGVLIGKNTYGKGVVQSLNEWKDGSAVKLTISNYYTPNGHNINKTGISPDYEVELEADTQEEENDSQLRKALELAGYCLEKV